ncbi:MAG: protein kinase domain-containing protein [Limisphaerales bacterium]
MNPSREEALVALALMKPAAERAAFLERECGDDADLRRRVEELLATHKSPDSFLDPKAAPPDKATVIIPPEEGPGSLIGRYKILEKIGEGGFGIVYVAEQKEPVKRRVALKIIKLGMDTKQVVARFEAERQALALMDHLNIAKVFDAGATGTGRPFFVMELVKGISITKYCDQEKLSTRHRLDLFMKVCQAIQHAHQKGIIHRDIKPSNILVTLHDGVPVPKVIDFGIAKATAGSLTEQTLFTRFEQFLGTPAYMSPEQAEAGRMDIDTRSDIYSLGVVLYELLTGRTPFDSKALLEQGIEELILTLREVEPPRPSTRLSTLAPADLETVARSQRCEVAKLVPSLRADLDWIVMKALDKDRTRRYETANGLARDIERHLNNEPVAARPPSAAYRLQKLVRRNRLTFAAAAAVVAALLLGLAASTLEAVRLQRAEGVATKAAAVAEEQRQRAAESELTARREAYASDMYLAQQRLKDNDLGQARRLLDRHRPQPGEEDLRGWEWRYLWQLTRSTALVTLTNRPVRGWSLSFSSDGSRLAVGWMDGRVDLWDVPGRRWIQSLTVGGKDQPEHVAFSPVRNLLAAISETDDVSLYDLETGRESILWRSPDQGSWSVRDLEFSQDGSRVVIYASTYSQERGDAVWVVNVSSAKIESRHPTGGSFSYHFGAAQLSADNQRLFLARPDPLNYRCGLQCLDLRTGKELWQTEPQRDSGITALAISPDGRVLASSSGFEDLGIRIWDVDTGRLLVRLDGHSHFVCRLAFSKDGRRLISAACDQSIRIWDTGTWTEAKVLRGHRDAVNAVAISQTAHLIASASMNGDLMLWNDEGNQANDGYLRLPNNLLGVMPLDHSRVVLVHPNNPPEWFDLSRGTPLGSIAELGPSTNVCGFGTNWLCHWDGTNQILVDEWTGSRFSQLGAVTLDPGTRPIEALFNPARQLVAWNEAVASNSVFLATLATPGRRRELKSKIDGLCPYLFSDDGKYLTAIAPQSESLCLWNVDAGQSVIPLSEQVSDAAFAIGGRVLVALGRVSPDDNEIRFYDLDHPDRAPRRISGKHEPSALALSPDGRLVAASTQASLVRLCDAATGELIADLPGYSRGVAFSKDGRRLISAGGGRETVELLDVGTRQALLHLVGTGPVLKEALWSADGDTIIVGSPQRVWQAWHAPSWEEIAAAEKSTEGKTQ